MKIPFIVLFSVLLTSVLLTSALLAQDLSKGVNTEKKSAQEHNAWLKQRFSEQHKKLIPVIAVADMFYACNIERKVDPIDYQLSDLVLTMDENRLAQKLALCLGDDTIQSDVAINFGLLGCFHEQLAHLPKVERQQKMLLVNNAIHALSSNERKKSFIQCVTEQAIHYLK
ncbi:hypothetical protein [Candidatus Colwellia aromaticivorans]|uniref:hypothetical protein n=1 Tax=Candidatus Colwellia aromaticivorans TaxID=2267621 RepID=UPI00109B9086|nr:hypothetical protein [Candidatus Colwellia aromaticivorans]